MGGYIKYLTLLALITLPFELRADLAISESLVEKGDYYVGHVFGKQPYAAHTNISLAPFFIMKKEITYAFYQQVLNWANEHGYSLNSGCNGALYEDCLLPDQDSGRHPVTNIEWLDTVVFANALSEMLNFKPVYLMQNGQPLRSSTQVTAFSVDPKATGYRLPTLNEWQVAARGGKPAMKSGSYGHRHSGSNEAKKVAWYPPFDGPDAVGTAMVGQLSPNALGIFDMSGNVSEWVYDSYQIDNTAMYYFCGGSFLSHATSLASCDSHSSGFVMPDIGFRLVRSTLVEH